MALFSLLLALLTEEPTAAVAATITLGRASCDTVFGSREDSLQSLVDFAIQPVLDEGNRGGVVRMRRNARARTISLWTPAGDYRIALTRDRKRVYPTNGLPELRFGQNGRVDGYLQIYENDLFEDPESIEGLVRCMARGDPYFHPQSFLPGAPPGPSRETKLQRRAIDALLDMEARRGRRRGLTMPTGTGKTVVAAKYTAELGVRRRHRKGWKKKPKVLFVVQNVAVLDKSVTTFQRELGMKRTARIYGSNDRDHWDRDAEIVAITRSSYFSRRRELHELLTQDPDQPWVIVFDEGHHLGKVDGEFAAILTDLAKVTDHRHRELLLSPFFYHRDQSLIVDHLGGNVWGPYLTKAELARLRRGRDLVPLARKQFYAAMRAGYLSPLERLHLVRKVGDDNVRELLESEMRDRARGRRTVRWSAPLLDDVTKRLIAGRVPGQYDRGVIFADSRDRADIYARELSRRLKAPVRALHSGLDGPSDTLDWFSAEADEHRYVVVVDMLREGVDVPPINALVLLRSYGPDVPGFGNLLQNLGRGTRIHARIHHPKLGLRLLDYTLYSRWLRDGLAAITVEERPDRGDTNNFTPLVVVDDEILDAATFRARYLELFPEDASFAERFPTFDPSRFREHVLPILFAQHSALGLRRFSTNWGPKELALRLAESLPPSEERDLLLAELDDDDAWGWTANDGVMIGSGHEAATRRLFLALHHIGLLARLYPEGEKIDPERLGEPEHVRRLLGALVPLARPLDDFASVRKFLGNDGGFERLFEEAARLSGDSKSLEALLRELANQIPSGPARLRVEAFIAQERTWNADNQHRDRKLSDDAIRELLATPKSNQRLFQRTYRFLLVLADAYNETRPTGRARIRLDRLLTRTGVEDLIHALRPQRTTADVLYSAGDVDLFAGPDGGLLELRERAALFGLTGVTGAANPYAGRTIASGAARLLGDDRGNALAAEFLDPTKYAWSESEGTQMVANRSSASSLRLLRALGRVAQALAARGAHRTDPAALHTRRGMQTFLDELAFGVALPFLDDARVREFANRRTGALGTLLGWRTDHPRPQFWHDHGVAHLLRAVIEKRSKAKAASRLRALLDPYRPNSWGWKPRDADASWRGDPAALRRSLRALLATAAILEREGVLVCDLEEANTKREIERCFR